MCLALTVLRDSLEQAVSWLLDATRMVDKATYRC